MKTTIMKWKESMLNAIKAPYYFIKEGKEIAIALILGIMLIMLMCG